MNIDSYRGGDVFSLKSLLWSRRKAPYYPTPGGPGQVGPIRLGHGIRPDFGVSCLTLLLGTVYFRGLPGVPKRKGATD